MRGLLVAIVSLVLIAFAPSAAQSPVARVALLGALPVSDPSERPAWQAFVAAETPGIERSTVARQGRLGLRAADQIIPIVAIEIGARLGDELVQVLKSFLERLGHGCSPSLVCLVWQAETGGVGRARVSA
jgi:hypothetical protein